MAELITGLLSAVAAAAGTIFLMGRRRQQDIDSREKLRTDLNGLGKRVREEHIATEFRALTMALMSLALEEDAQTRRWMVEKIIDGWRRP